MRAAGMSPPDIGLFLAQESSVCWAGWSPSPWAHLCIWGTRPCRACHPRVLPLPVRAAGWLVWKGRRCGRAGGVEGSGCVVFTNAVSTHMTWLENMEGAQEGLSNWVSGAEGEG